MRRVVLEYDTPSSLKAALQAATDAVNDGHDLTKITAWLNEHQAGCVIIVHRKACPLCSAQGLAGFAWEKEQSS